MVAEDAINLLNSSCNSTSQIYKVNILASKKETKPKKVNNKIKSPPPKKRIKIREKVVRINSIDSKKFKEFKTSSIVDSFDETKKIIEVENLVKGAKTKKQVTIVMHGHKIIEHKVWIDGVQGKFVQSSKRIIRQGDVNAGVIIEETVYYKSVYGYNSKKRIYSTGQNHTLLKAPFFILKTQNHPILI